MKRYYDKEYKSTKSKSYLSFGLIMSAFSLFMIVLSILSITHKAAVGIILTGFGAGIAWGFAAAVCLSVYYRDNRTELKERASRIAESVAESVESVKSVESFLKK